MTGRENDGFIAYARCADYAESREVRLGFRRLRRMYDLRRRKDASWNVSSRRAKSKPKSASKSGAKKTSVAIKKTSPIADLADMLPSGGLERAPKRPRQERERERDQ